MKNIYYSSSGTLAFVGHWFFFHSSAVYELFGLVIQLDLNIAFQGSINVAAGERDVCFPMRVFPLPRGSHGHDRLNVKV